MNNLSILLNGFMLDDQGHPTEAHPLKALFTPVSASTKATMADPQVSWNVITRVYAEFLVVRTSLELLSHFPLSLPSTDSGSLLDREKGFWTLLYRALPALSTLTVLLCFFSENSLSCAVSNPDVSQRLKETLKKLSIGLGTFMRPPRGEISKFLAPGNITLSSDKLDEVYNPNLRAAVRAADPAITRLFLSSISYGKDVALREPSMEFSSRQTAESVAPSSPTGSASFLRERSSLTPSHSRTGTGLPRDSILALLWESASEAHPSSRLGGGSEASGKSGVSKGSPLGDDLFASFLEEDV